MIFFVYFVPFCIFLADGGQQVRALLGELLELFIFFVGGLRRIGRGTFG
jgi:hypothetical protein